MHAASRTFVHPFTGAAVALCYQRVGRTHAVSVVSQSGESEEWQTDSYERVEAARDCWRSRQQQLLCGGFVPAR